MCQVSQQAEMKIISQISTQVAVDSPIYRQFDGQQYDKIEL